MAKVTSKEAGAAETAENRAEAKPRQAPEKEQNISQEFASTQEAVYKANELAVHAKKLFGTRQECVAAALQAVGKTEGTVAEAKKIVEKFLSREVK